MNKKTNAFVALGMLFSVCTYAQENQQPTVETLEEVVLTDSRFALKRENSGKTVITISKEEIEKNQGRSVAELINTKSGIEVNGSRSNAGQNLGVFVRGGRNRQVLVIIDGVQVSDPSQINGEYDLRLLSLGNIEKIEVIKGAASTLYGSGAAAAVINITTKDAGDEAVNVVINSSVGTNQSQDDQDYRLSDFNNSVNVNGTLDKFTYKAGYNQQFTDGLSAALIEEGEAERDAFSKKSFDLNLGYQFTDAFSVNIFGNITDINSDFDGGAFFDAPGNEFNSDQYRVGISSTYKYNKGSVHLNASYSTFDRAFISDFPFFAEGENLILDVYNKYTINNSFYTIVGLNVIDNQATFEGNTVDENPDFNIVDPYANVVYVSDFGLNINAGARLNNHSEYGSNFTYNINPSYTYKFGEGSYVKPFGSYSTSFITPSLNQLFGNFGPNPELDPEENLTIEGGVEVKLGKNFRASALYFDREETDVIQFDFEAGYFNSEEVVNTSGIEVEVNATPVKNLSLTANYTYIDNENNAVLIPESKANFSVGYDFSPRTFASVAYQYTDDRLANDFREFPATEVTLESFSLVNLAFGHTLKNEKWRFLLSVDNVLNEDYQDVFGFTSRGANVKLGVTLNLL
ncbi:TonB-dependent receptor plug domain-containing protein [uncultured Dokdonia sp.]|uniref:TonB-dependent receptor plug domain-containing protein n=1 Tax=uncultured Dokdonia sp. TaxID=575653 RepID=UPI00261FCE2A|nr:TonB-dependent receptor plug domain-containing protein [uncultured Dokdonia sp.]